MATSTAVREPFNIVFQRGKCPVCDGPIEVEWAGENPSLGTICKKCTYANKRMIFTPAHLDFQVEKKVVFDPLLRSYGYHFDWKGTRVKVNGVCGSIRYTQGDASRVRFDDQDAQSFGTFINHLGYRDLIHLYEESGGDTTPPPLELPQHTPKKRNDLLPASILPVEIKTYKGTISSVEVGEYGANHVPFIQTLHAFTSFYTRWFCGLAPNYCFEGGFMGHDFEVRNNIDTGAVGLHVTMEPIKAMLDGKTMTAEELIHILQLAVLIDASYQSAQSLPEVQIKDISAGAVVAIWARLMETLLRYDWRKEKVGTPQDIWRCFCIMQDVALEVMSSEALAVVLVFAPKAAMRHCGYAY